MTSQSARCVWLRTGVVGLWFWLALIFKLRNHEAVSGSKWRILVDLIKFTCILITVLLVGGHCYFCLFLFRVDLFFFSCSHLIIVWRPILVIWLCFYSFLFLQVFWLAFFYLEQVVLLTFALFFVCSWSFVLSSSSLIILSAIFVKTGSLSFILNTFCCFGCFFFFLMALSPVTYVTSTRQLTLF